MKTLAKVILAIILGMLVSLLLQGAMGAFR